MPRGSGAEAREAPDESQLRLGPREEPIDWTCTLLMATSLVSVLLHPTELALVKLPSDVQGYMNWRDHYVRKMVLQGARRDQDVADAILRVRSWFTHSRWARSAASVVKPGNPDQRNAARAML